MAPKPKPPPTLGTIDGPFIVEPYAPRPDGLPHLFDKVRFKITAASDYPFVTLTAVQDGITVMQSTESYSLVPNATLDDGVFGLGSVWWNEGGAICTAQVHWKEAKRTVWGASITFEVLP